MFQSLIGELKTDIEDYYRKATMSEFQSLIGELKTIIWMEQKN